MSHFEIISKFFLGKHDSVYTNNRSSIQLQVKNLKSILLIIKKTKKEEIIVIKKLSLWQKLKKMLGF